MKIGSTITLNDGVVMPRFGLGVYQSTGKSGMAAIKHALSVGYRHIDTAALYSNEAEVGQAVRECGIARDQVFVTTKLWNADQGYDSTLKAGALSLKKLGLDKIDLYLIHWPEPGKRRDSWRALIELRERGVTRSIGVSNYTVAHLKELLAQSKVKPSVNQVEFNPFLYQRDLLSFCNDHGIALVAYCPLARAQKLKDARLRKIAESCRKTPAQVMLRWGLQRGVGVIPKSVHPQRIEENAALFDFTISDADMKSLDALNEGLRTSWDPSNVR